MVVRRAGRPGGALALVRALSGRRRGVRRRRGGSRLRVRRALARDRRGPGVRRAVAPGPRAGLERPPPLRERWPPPGVGAAGFASLSPAGSNAARGDDAGAATRGPCLVSRAWSQRRHYRAGAARAGLLRHVVRSRHGDGAPRLRASPAGLGAVRKSFVGRRRCAKFRGTMPCPYKTAPADGSVAPPWPRR